jgi:hypothetical protein
MATLETRPQDPSGGDGDHLRTLAEHLTRSCQLILAERAIRAGKTTIPRLRSEPLLEALRDGDIIDGDEEARALLADMDDAGIGPGQLQDMARTAFRNLRPPSRSPELLAHAEAILEADEVHRLARSALIGERAADLAFELRMNEVGPRQRPDPDREWRRRLLAPRSLLDFQYRNATPGQRRKLRLQVEAAERRARRLRGR